MSAPYWNECLKCFHSTTTRLNTTLKRKVRMLTHCLRAPFIWPNSRDWCGRQLWQSKTQEWTAWPICSQCRPQSQIGDTYCSGNRTGPPTNTAGGTRYPQSHQEPVGAVEQIAVGEYCSLLSLGDWRWSQYSVITCNASLVADVLLALDEAPSVGHLGVTRTFHGSTRMVYWYGPQHQSSVRRLVDSSRSSQRGSSVDSSSKA